MGPQTLRPVHATQDGVGRGTRGRVHVQDAAGELLEQIGLRRIYAEVTQLDLRTVQASIAARCAR